MYEGTSQQKPSCILMVIDLGGPECGRGSAPRSHLPLVGPLCLESCDTMASVFSYTLAVCTAGRSGLRCPLAGVTNLVWREIGCLCALNP